MPARLMIVLLLTAVMILTGCGVRRSQVYLWPPADVNDTP